MLQGGDDDHRHDRELHDRPNGRHDRLPPDPQVADARHDEREGDHQYECQSELPRGFHGHVPIMTRCGPVSRLCSCSPPVQVLSSAVQVLSSAAQVLS